MTQEQRRQARELAGQGFSRKEIAARVGLKLHEVFIALAAVADSPTWPMGTTYKQRREQFAASKKS